MDEILKILAAGGDASTLAIAYVLIKHSNAIQELKTKLNFVERFLINGGKANG